MEKEFATDTADRQILRTDTLSFTTKQEREYGELRLRLLNLDLTKNPVLQFVQGNDVKYSYPLTSRNFNLRLFQPGDYDLRILFDDNKNGKWDPGEFFENRRQPEKYRVHTSGYGLAPGFPPTWGEPLHMIGGSSYTLAAGMVVTVEPPVFIGPEKLGARIIDNVLVTETGCELLSRYSREIIVRE
jgi:hypothetical protein